MSWTDGLERLEARHLEAHQQRFEIAAWAETFPSGFFAELARLAAELLMPAPAPRFDFLVESPDGQRHRLSAEGEVLRIGFGAACQLRLAGDGERGEVCELRDFGDSLWLSVSGTGLGVRIGRHRLVPGERRQIAVGKSFDVDSHRLTLEAHRGPSSPEVASFEVHGGECLPFPESPFERFDADDAWLVLRAGAWRGYLRPGIGWLAGLYQDLRISAPQPPSAALAEPFERHLTRAAVERLAAEVQATTGVELEVGEWLRGVEGSRRVWRGGKDHLTASFALRSGVRERQVHLVWPMDSAPAPPMDWLRPMRWRGSVLAGSVDLDLPTIRSLKSGDVLLPDNWWPKDDGAGEVRLLASGLWRKACGEIHAPHSDSQPDDGPQADEIQSDQLRNDEFEENKPSTYRVVAADGKWRPLHRGALPMSEIHETTAELAEFNDNADGLLLGGVEADLDLEGFEGEVGEDLEHGLELTLAFELAQLTASLDELRRFDQGEVLELERGADEPVRILILHAGGAMPVGSGRIVLLEDERLGIRIETWDRVGEPTEQES